MRQGFRSPVPVETTLAPQSPAGGCSSASVLMLELLDILDLPVKRLKTEGGGGLDWNPKPPQFGSPPLSLRLSVRVQVGADPTARVGLSREG